MSAVTYGSESSYSTSTIASRNAAMHRPFQIFLILGDFFLISLSYLAANAVYQLAVGAERDVSAGAGLIVATVFIVAAYLQDVYGAHRLLSLTWQLRKVAFAWMLSLAILAAAAFLLKSTSDFSRGTILLFALTGLVGLCGHRIVWRFGFASAFARERLIDRKVVLLSLKSLDFTSNRFKDLRKHGFDVVRHFVISTPHVGD